MLISLFFVRGGYRFTRVSRLNGFNIRVDKDEFAIAATLKGMLTILNVRHVVLD